MKLVNLKLIALFVISYSLALVVLTPLSWLMPMIEPRLNAQGISTVDVQGNIWQGEGQIRSRFIPAVTVSWELNPAYLLLLRLPIDLKIQNPDLNLTGRLVVSPLSVSIQNVAGHVDENAAKNIYSRYGVTITGRLQLSEVSADMSWGRSLGDASGSLSWSGGPLSFPVGRSTQNYEVPTLFGQIQSDDSRWLVAVTGSADQEYIQASLARDGMGTLSVKRELANEMKIPVPGNGSSLIDISQQVLHGL